MIRAVCKSIGRTVPAGIQGWTKREASQFIDTIKTNPPAPEQECADSSWEKNPDDRLRKNISRPSHQTGQDAAVARVPCLTIIAPSRSMAVRRQRIPRPRPRLNICAISRSYLLRIKSSRRQTVSRTRKVRTMPCQRRH
jgi:hypothetical protein